jgi:hypothetical protein
MERNIGASNRRIPPDVRPMGSAARDLDRAADYEDVDVDSDDGPESPDASIVDHD